MEVAVMGSRAKLRTKEGGNRERSSRLEGSEAEAFAVSQSRSNRSRGENLGDLRGVAYHRC
jgi:hypothetical protein